MSRRSDVVIVGGGVMGCSVAYHLKRLDPAVTVMVIERDPTYARASSALSASSIRQHFSVPVNVLLSQHSFEFLRHAAEHLSVDGTAAEIGLVERGYLYLAGSDAAAAMRSGHAVQKLCGADVALLEPAALAQRFGWLNTDGIALASLGLSGEGWFDGYSLLQAFRRKARELGTEFLAAEVGALHFAADAAQVHAGEHVLDCAAVVNAAGPHAASVARMAGAEIPVVPEPHCIFSFSAAQALPDCPLVIDPSGIYFRPEGRQFIAGVPTTPAALERRDSLDVDHALFDEVLWPALAARVPAFEAIRATGAWAGWYEMNAFDRNALIGAWPGQPNFLLINGFSGHGIQQSPAAGRALAEIILRGRSITLDVSELSPARLACGRRVEELNII